MVGALATCTVTLREGPPLMPGSLGLQVPLHPGGRGYTHHLQWDSQVLWGCSLSCLSHGLGSASPPLLFPWLHLLHVKNLLPFRCTAVCISGVPMCWIEKKKTLFVMLSTSCRLRGETKRVSSATIILTSPMIDFSPQAIRLKLGLPRCCCCCF